MSEEIFAELPPPPSFPAPPTPHDDLQRRRKLSDTGKTLIRETLTALESSPRGSTPSSSGRADVFTFEKPDAPLPPPPEKVLPAAVNDAYHAETVSSEEEDVDIAETHLVRVPRTAEARMELVTTERPFMPLSVPIHNPVDVTLIVPDASKTFKSEPFIEISLWRGEAMSSGLNSPVDAIRRSIRLSRRSLTTAAADAISSIAQQAGGEGIAEAAGGRRTQYMKKRMSEKRLAEITETEKESQKQRDLIMQGIASDYTLFNRDWSVLLRGRRSAAHWTQLRNRQKHSEVTIFAGASESSEPVATLKAGARASRLLMLERQSDGGTVYTLAKEKIGAYRVFWIAEGRKANGLVDPEECKFLLVIRRGRIMIKCKGESTAGRFQQPTALSSSSSAFTTTVLDLIDKPGKAASCKIATGMDLVLAFACLLIADRFERYSCFIPDEKTRTGQLHDRFETDVGDEDIDVFHKSVRGFAAAGPDSLLY